MSHAERRKKGVEMIKEVYAGDVVTPPEGNVFTDVMLEQVFAEVWSRDVLSIGIAASCSSASSPRRASR